MIYMCSLIIKQKINIIALYEKKIYMNPGFKTERTSPCSSSSPPLVNYSFTASSTLVHLLTTHLLSDTDSWLTYYFMSHTPFSVSNRTEEDWVPTQ